MEFYLPNPAAHFNGLKQRVAKIGTELAMDWQLIDAKRRKRVVLFASTYDHCLLDLLWRWRRGDLYMEIVAVVSNRPDLEAEVARFGVPYDHIPVTRESKPEAERVQLDLFAGAVDLVVMARYMQILSGHFLERASVAQ